VIVGAVLEIGIEPTARHAADLGLLPVVVTDACGAVGPKPPSARSPAWTTRGCPTARPRPRPRSSTPSEPADPGPLNPVASLWVPEVMHGALTDSDRYGQ